VTLTWARWASAVTPMAARKMPATTRITVMLWCWGSIPSSIPRSISAGPAWLVMLTIVTSSAAAAPSRQWRKISPFRLRRAPSSSVAR
jgi:hypothetical protein